jgi:hypothetical protein
MKVEVKDMKRKPVTVNQLLEMCKKAKEQGLGDKEVYMSSDDECNDFHALWTGFEQDEENKDIVLLY